MITVTQITTCVKLWRKNTNFSTRWYIVLSVSQLHEPIQNKAFEHCNELRAEHEQDFDEEYFLVYATPSHTNFYEEPELVNHLQQKRPWFNFISSNVAFIQRTLGFF